MQITGRDAICRYIPAPGTQLRDGSPFGGVLSGLGIELPRNLGLELMVTRGWVQPALRVKLPREALDAWKNYPELSVDAPDCPPDCTWALNLYVHAMSSGWPNRGDTW